jgi:heparan-alpha-glucosaminide N-acetyltransferase
MLPYNSLPNQRIHSIDVLRGLTILLMIFVNEIDGIRNIPHWLHHMPRDVDGMTVVDWVFPGFLFIVGMSIPLALHNRIQKGDNFWQLQKHILVRTVGLLVLGVFMVNAEGGYNEEAMGMPIGLWSLLFYPCVILVWNIYTFDNKMWTYILRGIGIIGLIILASIYRAGDGTEYIQPRWWGILGLIGWAYFYSCILYQLFRGNKYYLAAMVGFCALVYVVGHTGISEASTLLGWTRAQSGNATHTGLALCGMVLTLIFFDLKQEKNLQSRLNEALAFAAVLFVVGWLLRPYFHIGKIWATPTWGLYSSVIAIIVFILLYWIADLKGINRWTTFFRPAGSNPLLTYIIPFIMWASYDYFDYYPLPEDYQTGIIGALYCVLYAVVILWIVKWLNRLHIRLQL